MSTSTESTPQPEQPVPPVLDTALQEIPDVAQVSAPALPVPDLEAALFESGYAKPISDPVNLSVIDSTVESLLTPEPVIAPPKSEKTRKIKHPSWRFMLSNPAHVLALGFGSGLPWVAPGTFGTLFGWVSFIAINPYLNDQTWAMTLLLGFFIGCWACQICGKNLGVSDHGSIVWDEIIAIWLVLWMVPKTVPDQVAAFLLFRLIDITKPQPIRYFDAKWKTGFGVMFDDLLAAFYTLLFFAVYYRVVGLPS
jgi:phosphatidylglycerophosphatase A